MARISEDNTSYRASGIERRDFRHTANGPEVTGKPRKHKDTKRWCKGIQGREHVLVTVMGKNDYFNRGCGDFGYMFLGSTWVCHHEVKCENCGKVLDSWLGDRCPSRPTK